MSLTGFTLVEIMVVAAIVGLLVSLAVVEGVEFRKQANEANCQANLKSIASGFEIYAARHGGVYAQQEETDLQFLLVDGCLNQDLISAGRVGNFRFVASSIGPGGYDIKAMAINPALANHNFQITTAGILRRSDTSAPGDIVFKDF